MKKKLKIIPVVLLIGILFANSIIINDTSIHATAIQRTNTSTPQKSTTDSIVDTPQVGREVIIAVIDTGIDYTHDVLKNSMWTNSAEIAEDGIDNDLNGFVDDVNGWNFYDDNNLIYDPDNNYDNHGTHCAGIMANLTSTANVKIMSVKALGGSNRSGTSDALVKAIQYAELMGASICNISAGTRYNNTALESIVKDSKMLFIVAAGNEKVGTNNDEIPVYPASYDFDNIISVANLNNDNSLHITSNYSVNSVDLAAPGTDISSTFTHNEYGYLTGTSTSAPMVTGAIALIYSNHPEITLLQAKESVLNTVTALPSLTDKVLTGGTINVEAAISYYTPTQVTIIEKKSLKVKKTYTLKPALTPVHASSTFTYTSSNKKVATVNNTTGKITAKKKGTSIITVETPNGLIATCIISVK